MRGVSHGFRPRACIPPRSAAAATADPPRAAAPRRWLARLVCLGSLITRLVAVQAQPPSAAPSPYVTEVAVGKVVFLAEAMEQATGARAVPEARQRVLALQTSAGNYIPLLEDVRGRAFRTDQRLRQMQVKLWLRRYAGFPLAQILRVVEVTPDGEFEIDYWCDVCAIALFEQKECDCCQGPVVLRRRKLDHTPP
jgi:hypothetical protein